MQGASGRPVRDSARPPRQEHDPTRGAFEAEVGRVEVPDVGETRLGEGGDDLLGLPGPLGQPDVLAAPRPVPLEVEHGRLEGAGARRLLEPHPHDAGQVVVGEAERVVPLLAVRGLRVHVEQERPARYERVADGGEDPRQVGQRLHVVQAVEHGVRGVDRLGQRKLARVLEQERGAGRTGPRQGQERRGGVDAGDAEGALAEAGGNVARAAAQVQQARAVGQPAEQQPIQDPDERARERRPPPPGIAAGEAVVFRAYTRNSPES